MMRCVERLWREDDGHHMVAYAMWVSALTAIVQPYWILALGYQVVDTLLLLKNQFLLLF